MFNLFLAFIASFFGVKRGKVASPAPFQPLLKLDLQLFSDEPGVDDGGIADPEVVDDLGGEPGGEIPPEPSGENPPPAPNPQEDIEQSQAFAKRLQERTQKALAEERAKWEQEVSQKYGNYDQYQQTMDYILQQTGHSSFDEFQQFLQQQQLAERAQQNGIDPEFQQRVESLEEKARLADELAQQREQEQMYNQFQTALQDFSKERGIEAQELENFMVENNIASFDMAYRAMRYEQMENDLKNAKDIAVKEYLESKKAPKVEGTGAPGVIKDKPPTSWDESRQRALARLNSNGNE